MKWLPSGDVAGDDPAMLGIGMAIFDGRVMVSFSREIRTLFLSPEDARGLAGQMIHMAEVAEEPTF